LIICIVLLVAFGPVLWLIPSKKDKRLAGLRERARKEGFVVELKRLPKLDPTPEERVSAGGRPREPVVECAAYSCTMVKKLDCLPPWRLLRTTDDSASQTQNPAKPRSGWVFETGRRPQRDHLSEMLDATDEVFEVLPGDVLALEVTTRQLTFYWLEKPNADLSVLSTLMAHFQAWEARLRALDEKILAAKNTEDS
jgi:hypothetical protein